MFETMKTFGTDYRALVIGASGGIGKAFAGLIETDPASGDLVRLSRSVDGLDITDDASVEAAARVLGERGQTFDLILCATGALTIAGRGPEKTIRAVEAEAMMAQFALNAVGPALLLRHFSPLLSKDRKAAFALLSARVGSIGDNRLGGWISYRAAKAALNQIVHTAAIEIGRTHPQALVVCLHPGTVATTLSQSYSKGHDRFEPDDSAGRMLAVIDSLDADASGGFFAYDGKSIEW